MTEPKEAFFPALTSLWLRLSTVAMVALLIPITLRLPAKLSGTTFYMSTAEEVFEIALEIVLAALAGVAFGAVCAAAVAPFLLFSKTSRPRIVQMVTKAAVAGALFFDFAIGLGMLLESVQIWGQLKIAIFAIYLVAFALAMFIPRRREQLVTSLDDYLGEKATRRAVLGTGIAAVALVAAEAALGNTASAAAAPKRVSRPSGPNILLITFDALSAEDMSLYGRRLPTTPHIDQFARNSSVFTNFFSGSTFTTPSIATMLTGLAISEHGVYQLPGPLHGASVQKNLPRLMRNAGYYTGASIANLHAYFVAESIAANFDAWPAPAALTPGISLWDATQILHQHQPFGNRAYEFRDFQTICGVPPRYLQRHFPRLFGIPKSDAPPAYSFEQAWEVLEGMPDGFFMWVHAYAPHAPYLPAPPNLGRFLPSDAMRTREEQEFVEPDERYGPNQQAQIDQARLRYDEFLADADSAFGSFLSRAESAGRLRNTAVIVSADHGESFEGGIFTHDSKYQNRPQIHVPLIIRMPRQERGSRVEFTADQTSLAPTILEIAGVPRGDWMRGQSLLPWLNRNGEGGGEGMAFTQYLATNSIFKPVTHGTVGVIDGRHQYVLDLDSGKGILRGLNEAQSWNLDRSAEDPALAQTLREAIYARFPSLPHKPA